MTKLLTALSLGVALFATPAFACNPWVSPTDTTCAGLVMSVTATAPIVPAYNTVTPTGVVTGTVAFNTSGSPCVLSATTWVKLTAPASACGFAPATPL